MVCKCVLDKPLFLNPRLEFLVITAFGMLFSESLKRTDFPISFEISIWKMYSVHVAENSVPLLVNWFCGHKHLSVTCMCACSSKTAAASQQYFAAKTLFFSNIARKIWSLFNACCFRRVDLKSSIFLM